MNIDRSTRKGKSTIIAAALILLVGSVFFINLVSACSYSAQRDTVNTPDNSLIFPFVDEDPDTDGSNSTYYGQNGSIYYNNDSDFAFANDSSQRFGFKTSGSDIIKGTPPNYYLDWWTFDDNRTTDYIGNYDATKVAFTGGEYLGDGKVAEGYKFSTTNAAKYLHTTQTLPENGTFLIWANVTDTASNPAMMGAGIDTNNRWVLWRQAPGWTDDVQFYAEKSGTGYNTRCDGKIFEEIDGWQLIGITWEQGGKMRIWANATECPSYTNGPASTPSNIASFTDNIEIGRLGRNDDEHWRGEIGDAILLNKVLSQSEMEIYYNATEPTTGYDPTFGSEQTLVVNFRDMQGTVEYSNGTKVDGAQVLIIDQATNSVEYTTTSNSTGGWTKNVSTGANYTVVSYHPSNPNYDGDADPWIEVPQ